MQESVSKCNAILPPLTVDSGWYVLQHFWVVMECFEWTCEFHRAMSSVTEGLCPVKY